MAETTQTPKAVGPVQITGNTLEEVKRSVQFWLQQIVDRINALQGTK